MRRPNYKHYLLALLTIILLFNYVDRLALGVLLQDIKVDLDLSDTQLGFLGGISFALFYSIMGVPLARWADRGNRILVISTTAALWSVAVALCGVAGTFTQLLLIRVLVAVGEAGCLPPAYSLLADHFHRAERPRAAAIYSLGAPLSALVGYFAAGWLNDWVGWRMTFVLMGSPGLMLALLAWTTLREPRLTVRSSNVAASAHEQPSMREVAETLWSRPTFRHLLMCLSVLIFFNCGISMWQPAFFMRSFALTATEVGMWLALSIGVGALLGTYIGGEWASRRAAHNEALQLRAVAMCVAVSGVVMIYAFITPNKYLSFGLMTLVALGVTAANGPIFATIQTLVPGDMRAVAFALVYLVANLIGMGLGPLAAGALSDALRAWAGDDSLRYALLALSPGYLWVAWYARKASRTVTDDLLRVEQANLSVRIDEHVIVTQRAVVNR